MRYWRSTASQVWMAPSNTLAGCRDAPRSPHLGLAALCLRSRCAGPWSSRTCSATSGTETYPYLFLDFGRADTVYKVEFTTRNDIGACRALRRVSPARSQLTRAPLPCLQQKSQPRASCLAGCPRRWPARRAGPGGRHPAQHHPHSQPAVWHIRRPLHAWPGRHPLVQHPAPGPLPLTAGMARTRGGAAAGAVSLGRAACPVASLHTFHVGHPPRHPAGRGRLRRRPQQAPDLRAKSAGAPRG